MENCKNKPIINVELSVELITFHLYLIYSTLIMNLYPKYPSYICYCPSHLAAILGISIMLRAWQYMQFTPPGALAGSPRRWDLEGGTTVERGAIESIHSTHLGR